MTAEDMEAYCDAELLPKLLGRAQTLIDAHNVDPDAHPDIRVDLSGVNMRLSLLELMFNTEVKVCRQLLQEQGAISHEQSAAGGSDLLLRLHHRRVATYRHCGEGGGRQGVHH